MKFTFFIETQYNAYYMQYNYFVCFKIKDFYLLIPSSVNNVGSHRHFRFLVPEVKSAPHWFPLQCWPTRTNFITEGRNEMGGVCLRPTRVWPMWEQLGGAQSCSERRVPNRELLNINI